MSLVTLKEILQNAQKRKYAVGSFTVWNIDIIRAVVETAEELHAPAIVMFGPVEMDDNGKYGLKTLSDIALAYIHRAKVPIALHFDHSTSTGLLKEVIKHGFSSVMFDGSRLAYKENIVSTRQVVQMAKKRAGN